MRKLKDILREQDRPDDRDLTSRSDRKRAQRETEERLAALALALAACSEQRLRSLDLPSTVLDTVLDAKRITSAVARNRQLRIVRRELRTVEFQSIELRLASPRPRSRSEAADRVDAWVERLRTQGDDALDALCVEYPAADRRRIRQLMRNVGRGGNERETSRRALAAAVANVLASDLART
jgi:ribosome-associated protein